MSQYRKPSHTGNGTGVWVSTEYLKLTRSAGAALLLAQIVHWSRITTDPDGWFYKTYEEWYQELKLTKFEVMNAIGKPKKNSDQPTTPGTLETGFTLTELGVETKVFRNNNTPKVHYRVNMVILDEYWNLARAYISQSQAPDSKETSLSYESKETSLSIVEKLNFHIYTEIPTENKNILDPLDQAQPNPQTPPNKRTKAELNANYDLIASLWYPTRTEKPSAMIVNLCGLLFHDRNGKGEWKTARPATPLTHDEARAFAKWAKAYTNNAHLNGELPTSPVTLQSQVSAFRAQSHPKPIAPRPTIKPADIDHAQYIASLTGDLQ